MNHKYTLVGIAIVFIVSILFLPLGDKSLFATLISNADYLLNKVNKSNSVGQYEPTDLVSLEDLGYKNQRVRRVVYEDLKRMMEDAKSEGLSLKIVSAYRSFNHQQSLFSSYLKKDKNANRYSAEAGHSEHQLGTTIDFGSEDPKLNLNQSFDQTAEGRWLAENSYKYGFVMSYPKGYERETGYMYEPWHFRYIGVESAKEVNSLGIPAFAYIQSKDINSSGTLASKVPQPVNVELGMSRIISDGEDGKIYYITDRGYRHLIPSPEVFLSYGNKWSDVRFVSKDYIQSISPTKYIRNNWDDRIYSIDNGVKKLVDVGFIPDFNWSEVAEVNSLEFNSYSD